MATTDEILSVLLGRERRSDIRETTAQRSFAKARSVVGDYSRLISGHGYDFYAFPSPVDPVAHAKKPLIPMMISIVPPDNYPTGKTTTREVPSPSTAEISLTSLGERVAPNTVRPRTVTRVVPVDSQIAGRVADLREERQNAGPERAAQIDQEIQSLLAQVPSIEVEVPVTTPEGRELQVSRASEYLDNLRNRYEDFQEAARTSRAQFTEMNTPITGGNRNEVRDPWKDVAQIQDERRREVVGDLVYLREQALFMSELPPLFMYVNPNTFGLNKEHIVSDGNKVRHGFSIEFWGQQQVTLSASGSVGAFYVDSTDALGRGSGGLAVAARKGSYAYQQFLSLLQIYRSNGYIYNRQDKISLVGAVSIFYDGTIYTGSFNSLAITHSEDKPFTFDYNFDFTVRFKEDLRPR